MRFQESSIENRRRQKQYLLTILLIGVLLFIIFFLLSMTDEKSQNALRTLSIPSTNKEILKFFNIIDLDASKVTWSHAVNSKKKLDDALKGNTMFLEADILLIDDLHSEPIMAHPPETQSDLTFSEWLDLTILERRGLKLDLKTANSIEYCLNLLNSKQYEITGPVILNADVFQGEGAAPIKIQPSDLIKRSREVFPNGILSLGWTTTESRQSKYRWYDVYNVYSHLRSQNFINSNHSIEITFPVRALWSTKSIPRLAWLLVHTSPSASITVWSPATDELSSLESLLLFRHVFSNSLVYYDLPSKQDDFLKSQIYQDSSEWNRLLSESSDEFVKEFLSIEKANLNIESNWRHSSDVLMSKFGAVLAKKEACLSTLKEYKARDKKVIYELRGKFEVFSLSENQTSSKFYTTNTNESEEHQQNDFLRISLRSSINLVPKEHSTGSVNIYFYANGLIRIFTGDRLEQEANLQISSVYEYLITDVGEGEQIHIDVSSYDESDQQSKPYSIELLVRAAYEPAQEFYVHKCLTSSLYAIGIDILNISDEISDPQNNNV